MTDDLVRVTYQTTPDRKAWMKRQDRSIRELNERGIDLQMNDQERELENEIEEKDEQIAEVEETVQEAMNQLEELKEERSELVEQKQEVESQKQEYTDWLDDLLDWTQGNNGRLVTDVIKARDGFHDYQKDAPEIQKDLKDRAIEQKRELTAGDFTTSGPGYREKPLYETAEDGDEDSEDADRDGSSYSLNYDGGTADD